MDEIIERVENEINAIKEEQNKLEELTNNSEQIRKEEEQLKQERDRIGDKNSGFYSDLSKEVDQKHSEFIDANNKRMDKEKEIDKLIADKKEKIKKELEGKKHYIDENRNLYSEEINLSELKEEKEKLEKEIKLNDTEKADFLKMSDSDKKAVKKAKENYLNNKHRLDKINPIIELMDTLDGKTPKDKFMEIDNFQRMIEEKFNRDNFDEILENISDRKEEKIGTYGGPIGPKTEYGNYYSEDDEISKKSLEKEESKDEEVEQKNGIYREPIGPKTKYGNYYSENDEISKKSLENEKSQKAEERKEKQEKINQDKLLSNMEKVIKERKGAYREPIGPKTEFGNYYSENDSHTKKALIRNITIGKNTQVEIQFGNGEKETIEIPFKTMKQNLAMTIEEKLALCKETMSEYKIPEFEQLKHEQIEVFERMDPTFLYSLKKAKEYNVPEESLVKILENYMEGIAKPDKEQEEMKKILTYDKRGMQFIKLSNILDKIIKNKEYKQLIEYADNSSNMANVVEDEKGFFEKIVDKIKQKRLTAGKENEQRIEVEEAENTKEASEGVKERVKVDQETIDKTNKVSLNYVANNQELEEDREAEK